MEVVGGGRSWMAEDMRKALRYTVSNVVLWLKEAEREDDLDTPFRMVGSVMDFSFSGLGVRTKEDIREGEEVILRLGQGVQRSHALGRVAGCTPLSDGVFRVGIELDAADSQFIPRLIKSYLRRYEGTV
jgi:hypothetical protein